MIGEVRGVELLEERERARLDVGALVLVREVDGGVELGEVGDGEPIAYPREWHMEREREDVVVGRRGRADVHSPELGARHEVLEEGAQVHRMVGEADDGTAIEGLGRICGTSREHIREDSRILHQETFVDAEGSIAGEEDEIAVVEPEVGMANKFFLTMSELGRFSGSDDDDWCDTARDTTAFRRARIESHVTAMKTRKEATGHCLERHYGVTYFCIQSL